MKIAKNYSEPELLHDLVTLGSQDEAIKHLYREHYLKVQAYINQNGGADEDAEDIFQDAVINFIQVLNAGKFRGECSSGTFLYSLCRHAWLNEFKRKNRARLREEKFGKGMETIELDVSESLVTHEIKMELQQLLSTLGETCKKILLAFYYEELSMKEILLQLDYENEQVVRNKKYKCLKKLEEVLAAQPQTVKNLQSVLLYER
ncbi:RNA polymerase sigma factor [Flavihumibacter fluvii]|uniref:RNA polymerase sigma factor n=1 Tax=Flavihumibacter fluvii TaxID=2838157 RepID=UPI001BDEBC92|nr:sigma-70 family RNA polymerase sigma factor [Flavihumibacter fluvii]ULQ52052.1 sigma-70 family RNA polymerase sigma factor [Flavihumibacter fluvii]